MAGIDFQMGFGNEYMDDAERARREAESKRSAASGNPIAIVLDALGIGRQVAKPPKGDSKDTGDLASQSEAPETQTVAAVDKKGDVVGVVEQVLNQTGTSTDVQRLPMAPLSNMQLPRSIQRIDPTTGLPR
jgi:hypothetical protein